MFNEYIVFTKQKNGPPQEKYRRANEKNVRLTPDQTIFNAPEPVIGWPRNLPGADAGPVGALL